MVRHGCGKMLGCPDAFVWILEGVLKGRFRERYYGGPGTEASLYCGNKNFPNIDYNEDILLCHPCAIKAGYLW
jgi:hypothetical protein